MALSLVPPSIDTVNHRERGATPARHATEAYSRSTSRERNAAGFDAAAFECQRISGAGYFPVSPAAPQGFCITDTGLGGEVPTATARGLRLLSCVIANMRGARHLCSGLLHNRRRLGWMLQRQQPGGGEVVSPMIVYEGWSGLVSVRMVVNHRSKALPHLVAIET